MDRFLNKLVGLGDMAEGKVHIDINYCVAWGYLPQAAWIATEFFSEFGGDAAISLNPVGDGRLEIYLDEEKILDRSNEGGKYPDLDRVRQLKTTIRKKISTTSGWYQKNLAIQEVFVTRGNRNVAEILQLNGFKYLHDATPVKS